MKRVFFIIALVLATINFGWHVYLSYVQHNAQATAVYCIMVLAMVAIATLYSAPKK